MDKLQWIKELVKAEQAMEEAGVVDFSAGFDPDQQLQEATYDFMMDLKTAFVEAASAFNHLRGSAMGNIKIYGISKTEADFMLFRNGHKLIFSVLAPGVVQVSHNAITTQFLPGQMSAPAGSEERLQAHWGAFGELKWMHK